MNSKQNKANYRQPESLDSLNGFSLTELLIAVGIVGILSSIALPSFFRQIQTNCQAEAASNLNMIASYASAYKNIYGEAPENWYELNSISAVMTTSGTANKKRFENDPYNGKEDLKNGITVPSCDYVISRSSDKTGEEFIFNAVPTPNTGDKAAFNVVSCFDLSNGANDLKRGSKDVQGSATSSDLICWQ